MKKVILLFLIAAVMFSCKKNETTKPDVKKEAEVSFNITTIFPDAGRDWTYDVPECDPDAIAEYAKIKIDGVEGPDAGPGGDPSSGYFDVPVFWTNDNLYTQAIKLPVELYDTCTTYTISEFYLYDGGNNMIKAAPAPGSEFQEFVVNSLPLTFDVCAFEKIEIYIDVLCFTPDYFELFGFFWFEITQITVREICFFGDVCIDWWLDPHDFWNQNAVPLDVWYESTNYYQLQENGIQADMPAIFALALYKYNPATDEWEFINAWTNETWYGESAPLCFRYADYDDIDNEEFAIAMYIYGPWYYTPPMRNDIFGYTDEDESRDIPTWATGTPQHIWYFTDNALEDLDTDYPNGDGVIEFAWGDCVQDPEYPLPDLSWAE